MNAKQLRDFEREYQTAVVNLLGSEPQPTKIQTSRLDRWAVWVDQAGSVLTRLAGEVIQAGAVLLLLVFFAILEFERVRRGALALDQSASAARLIALALVVANVVHPVYRLREHRAAGKVISRSRSLRLRARSFWSWVVAPDEKVIERDQHYNPVLHVAAFVITWGTVLFACYDLLQPLLLTTSGPASWSGLLGALTVPSDALRLLAGVAASLGGVMFLQAASHEIGVRMVVNRPVSSNELYEHRLEDYNRAKSDLYARLHAEFVQRLQESEASPLVQEVQPVAVPLLVNPSGFVLPKNGNGNGNGHKTG